MTADFSTFSYLRNIMNRLNQSLDLRYLPSMAQDDNFTKNHLAFNLELVAYRYNLPERQRKQTIQVRSFKNKFDPSNSSNTASYSLEPTASELDQRNGTKTMWVEMRPTKAPYYGNKARIEQERKAKENQEGQEKPKKAKNVEKEAGKRKCDSVKTVRGYHTLEFDPCALRVVSTLQEKKTANYYVLVNPDESGLCEGYHISIDEVFFFSESRVDDITSYGTRKSDWPARIRAYTKQPDNGTAAEGRLHQSGYLVRLLNGESIKEPADLERALVEFHVGDVPQL